MTDVVALHNAEWVTAALHSVQLAIQEAVSTTIINVAGTL
jgi:hypothetical protein